MGNYLNPGNEKFAMNTNAKIYVDKTGLIEYCNEVINTSQRLICVKRHPPYSGRVPLCFIILCN